MIKGKIHFDREHRPQQITFGKSPFIKTKDGWIDPETKEPVRECSLEELLIEAGFHLPDTQDY